MKLLLTLLFVVNLLSLSKAQTHHPDKLSSACSDSIMRKICNNGFNSIESLSEAIKMNFRAAPVDSSGMISTCPSYVAFWMLSKVNINYCDSSTIGVMNSKLENKVIRKYEKARLKIRKREFDLPSMQIIRTDTTSFPDSLSLSLGITIASMELFCEDQFGNKIKIGVRDAVCICRKWYLANVDFTVISW